MNYKNLGLNGFENGFKFSNLFCSFLSMYG